MGLTDLLLVGFFLGIGLQGLPNWQEVAVQGCAVLRPIDAFSSSRANRLDGRAQPRLLQRVRSHRRRFGSCQGVDAGGLACRRRNRTRLLLKLLSK